jgi:hypothetical protein
MKKGDEQTGLVLRMDGTTERFTWRLGSSSLHTWRSLVPDTTFTSAELDEFGVMMLSDDEGKMRSDWVDRLNMTATIIYGNNYGLPLCNPNVMISGDALVIGIKVWGDGYETGLTDGQIGLIEKLAKSVKGLRRPSQSPIAQLAEAYGVIVIDT